MIGKCVFAMIVSRIYIVAFVEVLYKNTVHRDGTMWAIDQNYVIQEEGN